MSEESEIGMRMANIPSMKRDKDLGRDVGTDEGVDDERGRGEGRGKTTPLEGGDVGYYDDLGEKL
ncbi:hypothetical protein PHLCEN_2v3191 [Hermanssonia centrifuga]|uniref:Uncharacterized protein n=1 Tax=Hermanssonia centrifuga TaxID=98765 RepID=A0A2R6R0Y3_9APHY|nr:hypothetical protein PHLCEN_2v3191 [Hermanssonia centrifuga]